MGPGRTDAACGLVAEPRATRSTATRSFRWSNGDGVARALRPSGRTAIPAVATGGASRPSDANAGDERPVQHRQSSGAAVPWHQQRGC